MLILSRVCADFYDQNRNLLHKITQADLGLFHDAPESIRQDAAQRRRRTVFLRPFRYINIPPYKTMVILTQSQLE